MMGSGGIGFPVEHPAKRLSQQVLLAHGDGGRLGWELVTGLFHRHLADEELRRGGDAAVVEMAGTRLAFTTDSFVVAPLFFRAGTSASSRSAGR